MRILRLLILLSEVIPRFIYSFIFNTACPNYEDLSTEDSGAGLDGADPVPTLRHACFNQTPPNGRSSFSLNALNK